MAFDLEEQEKIDELKDWWKRWGNWVVGGIAVALLTASGTMWWRKHEAGQNLEALAVYEALLQAGETGNVKVVRESAGTLIDKYSSTPYASLAGLIAARANLENGDAVSAKAQLGWVADHAKDEGVAGLARIRLAAVHLDQKNHAEALKLLSEKLPAEYAGVAADLRGDIYFAQGKKAEARAEYVKARDATEANGPWRRIVELKLDGLGEMK